MPEVMEPDSRKLVLLYEGREGPLSELPLSAVATHASVSDSGLFSASCLHCCGVRDGGVILEQPSNRRSGSTADSVTGRECFSGRAASPLLRIAENGFDVQD